MPTLSPSVRHWFWRLALLAGLGAAGFAAWQYYGQAKPIEVSVAVAGPGRVEATVANTRAGAVKACRRAKLSPQGGGQIARLRVREGDRVKAGQVLLELWNADLAALAHQAEEQILTARAHRNEACAGAAAARREAGRRQQLAAQGFISAAQVDAAASDAEVKEAGCHAAGTEIAAATAHLDTARATLARSVLTAPFAGVVAEVTGEQGEYSTPSPPGIPTPPAIDLIDDSCLYVTAPIDEVDAPKIRVGQVARIALDAFPGRHFAGRVRRIAPYVLEVEKQARTVEVEVDFSDPADARPAAAHALLVGYSADVEIVLDSRERVLRIPTQALLQQNKVLLLRDGVLVERQVTPGLANWQHTEITQGLNPGDQVVVSLEKEGVKAGVRAVAHAVAK